MSGTKVSGVEYVWTLLQVFLVFVPELWLMLHGPSPGIVVGAATIGLIMWFRPASIFRVASTSALVIVACLVYVTSLLIFPYELAPFVGTTLLSSTIYAVTAAACLYELASRKSVRVVAEATALFHLLPTGAAWYIVHAQGPESIALLNENGTRMQVSEGFSMLGLFGETNILFWIVLLTTLSACAAGVFATRVGWITRGLSLVGLSAALYCNYITATRTVFGAFFVSLGFAAYVVLFQKGVVGTRRVLYSTGLALGVLAFWFLVVESTALDNAWLRRVDALRSDIRLEIWSQAIRGTLQRPFGGGIALLTAHSWAHNHLLDISLVGGIIPAAGVAYVYGRMLLLSARLSTMRGQNDGLPILGSMCVGGFSVSMTLPPQLGLWTFFLILTVLLSSIDAEIKDSRGASATVPMPLSEDRVDLDPTR